MVPSQRKLRSGRDEFRETLELLADGNPEPSRRYTAGRCRDYLSAGVALNDRLERPAPFMGEEIVHSHRKRRGRVNPLVLGSSPSGPTISSSANDRGGSETIKNTANYCIFIDSEVRSRSLPVGKNLGNFRFWCVESAA
jgi:hypothetical protein